MTNRKTTSKKKQLNSKKSDWKLSIALAVFVMLSTSAVCQQLYTISGIVQSSEEFSIPGVNVVIEQTQQGTISNANGYYKLKDIPAGRYTLMISALGFQTYTLPIEVNADSPKQYNISLTEKSYAIDDIEVVGKSVASQVNEQAYSVTSVSTKDLFNSTATAQQVLNKVPGVRITEEGGLGSNLNFTINGFSGDQIKFFMDGLPHG